jgi:pimeloyl-ACP methyl ester carboxylesterase
MEAASTSTVSPKLSNTTLKSDHGDLHITSTTPLTSIPPSTPAIFLIHGNSSSARIFTYIFSSPLALTHRILAFDLPGHGDSTNAPDPHRSYTQSGYGDAAIDVLEFMEVKEVIVLGWSLGGHIGIEMLDKLLDPDHPASKLGIRMRGLMLVGTPPSLGIEEVKAGFIWPDEPSAAKDQLTEAEIDGMADAACGSAFGGIPQVWMRANVLRTDGRARKRMFEAYRGREGCDQRAVMGKDLGTLVAVVNGAEEQFVDLDYVDNVKFERLWEGKCHRIPGHGHTSFYEGWETFQPFLDRFAKDCEAS